MKVESINCSYNKYKLPNKKHNSVGFRAASPKLFQQKPNFASRIKAFINSLFKKEQAVKGAKPNFKKSGLTQRRYVYWLKGQMLVMQVIS